MLDSQHGFRPKSSYLSNLLIFLEVTSYIDKGYLVDVIYLDFSKAFDMVPHRRLISKLTAHGIAGKTNRWIEHWLTDRRQRVYISGAESDWQKVISGVADCTTGINTRPNVICYLYKRHLLNCSKLPGKVC